MKLVRYSLMFTLLCSFGIRSAEQQHGIEQYSLNFMWINKSFNAEQQYIHPARDRKTFCDEFLNPIFLWVSKNRNAKINVWFDSALTPARAIENTRAIIDGYVSERPGIPPIVLRDVRDLPEVTNHPSVFSDQTPVFFRVDLLRVIAAVYSFATGEYSCFVYVDVDIPPLSQEELFDDETVHNLVNNGIVMAKAAKRSSVYENSFMMISNHKLNLFESLQWAIVDLNIARAYSLLKGVFKGVESSAYTYIMDKNHPLDQVVYSSFMGMIKYFWLLEGRVELRAGSFDFDKDQYGFMMFGQMNTSGDIIHCNDSVQVRFLPPYSADMFSGALEPSRKMIPIKDVNAPPSRFD